MAITTAVNDLFKSVYEVFASVVAAVTNAFTAAFNLAANLVTSFMSLIRDVVLGLVDIFEGLGKFLIGNILLVGLVAAGGFAYVRYQQQQKSQARIGTGKKTE